LNAAASRKSKTRLSVFALTSMAWPRASSRSDPSVVDQETILPSRHLCRSLSESCNSSSSSSTVGSADSAGTGPKNTRPAQRLTTTRVADLAVVFLDSMDTPPLRVSLLMGTLATKEICLWNRQKDTSNPSKNRLLHPRVWEGFLNTERRKIRLAGKG